MKVTYTIVSDTVTPDLRARLARAENPEPALRRMGEVLVNWARQAFRDASKRPATWPKLPDKTLAQKKGYGNKPLIASGALARLGGEAADSNEGLARSGAELAAVATNDWESLTLGGVTRSSWSSGGGGGYGWGEAVWVTNDWQMKENGNGYATIGVDSSITNVTVLLVPQTNFQQVTVRKFSELDRVDIIGSVTPPRKSTEA